MSKMANSARKIFKIFEIEQVRYAAAICKLLNLLVNSTTLGHFLEKRHYPRPLGKRTPLTLVKTLKPNGSI